MLGIYTQTSGHNCCLWIGITQRDANQRGRYREFKWMRSNRDIASTNQYWSNRYVPNPNGPEACGNFDLNGGSSRFHDLYCMQVLRFICWGVKSTMITMITIEFFHFEVNSNLSNYWKIKVSKSMNWHYLQVVIGHR